MGQTIRRLLRPRSSAMARCQGLTIEDRRLMTLPNQEGS
jgi:hypothetical protein